MAFVNPPPEAIAALLRKARTIAVVGASPDPSRPSHRVFAYLLAAGYRAIPIRPGGGEVLGVPAVPDLASLPFPPDIVDVFRAPEHVAGVVEEALAAGAGALWLQEGVVDEAAAERARAAGRTVVMDRCIMVDHRRWVAGA